jgi:hypothetical protein
LIPGGNWDTIIRLLAAALLMPPNPRVSRSPAMPKQSFALEPNGPKRLEVAWRGLWKDMRITLDGKPVGEIPNGKALREGREFKLPDGSGLKVQLVQALATVEFQITRDGQPLPASGGHPETRLKSAYITIYIIAGLNIILGTISQLVGIEYLTRLGIGVFSIVFGAVFVLLGFLVQRKILTALIIAIIILAVDGILGFILTSSAGLQPSAGGIILRIFLILPLFPAVKATRDLKRT